MKTIGLIGGMSWESSLEYYRLLNRGVQKRLGQKHSAEILMRSLDFEPIQNLQHQGAWQELSGRLVQIARTLEQAGAELILVCTNTMHKVAKEIEESISVPFLHIVDPVGEAIQERNLNRVALFGTKFTMEGGFYREKLKQEYRIETMIPNQEDRALVHQVIYEELCQGKIESTSKKKYQRIIDSLVQEEGAQGLILGCTEIMLLLGQKDISVPVFDTTELHVEKALDLVLGKS